MIIGRGDHEVRNHHAFRCVAHMRNGPKRALKHAQGSPDDWPLKLLVIDQVEGDQSNVIIWN
jgi:hypothetical protein